MPRSSPGPETVSDCPGSRRMTSQNTAAMARATKPSCMSTSTIGLSAVVAATSSTSTPAPPSRPPGMKDARVDGPTEPSAKAMASPNAPAANWTAPNAARMSSKVCAGIASTS